MKSVLALAVLVGVGHALLALLVRNTKLYWFERWALAFLIGTAAVSGLWIAFSPFYSVMRPVWLLSILSLGIMFYGARSQMRRRHAPGEGRRQESISQLDRILSLALAAEFVVLLLVALRTPLGWDGLFNFELKARLIFENVPSGGFPWPYLSDASRAWSHPQYPLMIPFAEFWIYSWLGHVDQGAIKILFPLFYFSLVGLVCGAMRRTTSARIALLTGIVMGLLPPLTLLPGAASGYADVPLAAAVVGSVCFAWLALRTGNTEAWVLAGALSAVATWTKAEGVLLAGCVAVSALAAVSSVRTRANLFWPLVGMVGIPLAATLPWLFVQLGFGMRAIDFVPVSASVVIESATRIQTVARLFALELLRLGHWGLIWPMWGSAIVLVMALRRRRAFEWFLAGSVLLPLVLYVFMFTLSAWPDPSEHVRLALPRLLVPLTPVALMFTVLTLHNGMSVEAT